ncbi:MULTISPECIES: hypothetical protein [unclassified Fibrobacter]|uniref:hypothetical protein n=1 Tax=unclassified Fibrobacter TaxID=2634177 RepID=UPI0025B9C732|nr:MULTISPECIES: hypothetical protein [unclassified Fibrobacter]
MTSNFMNIVAKASENKSRFDTSMLGLKDELEKSVSRDASMVRAHVRHSKGTTGWLPGALSYPWIFVCIVIPAVMDMFV